MSHIVGERTADPCPRCLVEELRDGVLGHEHGEQVVAYRCARCGNAWSRAVEPEFGEGDVVRVDLPTKTIYGLVLAVEPDRVLVLDTDRDSEQVWCDWWRVRIY